MFEVVFTPQAEANLAELDKTVAQRVLKKIRWLAENYESIMPEPLTGQWRGVYKLRVGDYRVLFTADQEQQRLVIRLIKHRREVYK